MKEQILKIAQDLEQGTITTKTAQTLLLGNQSTLNRTYQQGPSLFFNRALNSTEITQIYNHFSPTYK